MLIQEIKKYVPKCKIGICAYDENKENIFSFDENIIIDAACTLKVFIMLEYMKQINEKRIIGNEYLIVTKENLATGAGVVKFLSYGIRVKANDLVELMISISDHMAANMLIDFLGLNNINETIRDFGFENTKLRCGNFSSNSFFNSSKIEFSAINNAFVEDLPMNSSKFLT